MLRFAPSFSALSLLYSAACLCSAAFAGCSGAVGVFPSFPFYQSTAEPARFLINIIKLKLKGLNCFLESEIRDPRLKLYMAMRM
ncbi:hypothetical protein V2J09_017899 [Rumex salicifolius]